jgi:hypothetical protein
MHHADTDCSQAHRIMIIQDTGSFSSRSSPITSRLGPEAAHQRKISLDLTSAHRCSTIGKSTGPTTPDGAHGIHPRRESSFGFSPMTKRGSLPTRCSMHPSSLGRNLGPRSSESLLLRDMPGRAATQRSSSVRRLESDVQAPVPSVLA